MLHWLTVRSAHAQWPLRSPTSTAGCPVSGDNCEMLTARRQVTLEQLAWSKTASHSPEQQNGVRNPNGNPAIEDRQWPITSNGDFDQRYAESRPAVLNFPLGLQSTHSQCKDRPSEQQIVAHANNPHAFRSGDLLQRAVLSFPLQAAPPETSDSGSECLTRKWNAQESESTCCR